MPQTHGGKRALDGVGRAQVQHSTRLESRRNVQQHVAILRETRGGLCRYLASLSRQEQIEGTVERAKHGCHHPGCPRPWPPAPLLTSTAASASADRWRATRWTSSIARSAGNDSAPGSSASIPSAWTAKPKDDSRWPNTSTTRSRKRRPDLSLDEDNCQGSVSLASQPQDDARDRLRETPGGDHFL